MDTHVVSTIEGKRFNKLGHEIISCSNECGRDTTMTGTNLCDFCWEEEGRKKQSSMGEQITDMITEIDQKDNNEKSKLR
ncbi:MAG: hypothetical protein GY760_13960 [Deltaproteobacteria bacterium]|nr:hypothetical protein [Deltaproteobacteria bacterium]